MERVLVDTNFVISIVARADIKTTLLLEQLIASGNTLVCCRQSIFEFWAVATRPVESNGLGKTPAEAQLEIEEIQRSFRLEDDPVDLLQTWLKLCMHHSVRGKPSHDARLVAFAVGNGIDKIASLDRQIYSRFSEVHTITP